MNPFDPSSVVGYFDPHNKRHLQAYKELQQSGQWPPWFWEEIKDLTKPLMWQSQIAYKIADEWVTEKVGV